MKIRIASLVVVMCITAPHVWAWGSKPKFVRLFPKAAAQRIAPTAAEPGYLYITVDSNLDAMVSNPRFRKFDKGFYYLAVTARVALPDQADAPELPLALFNLAERTETNVASFHLTKGQAINLDSAFQPVVTLHVRAIPKSVATAYVQAVNDFSAVVSAIPIREIASRTPQLALATKVISAFTEGAMQDAKKEWHSTTSIGLTPGAESYLPLNQPVFIFLVPTGDQDPQTFGNRNFSVCPGGGRYICENGKRFVELPYLIVEARTSDYRPLTDFAEYPIDCNRTDAEYAAITSAIQSKPMTAKQRDNERRLASRLDVLQRLRDANALTDIDQTSDLVFAYASEPGGTDQYWQDHYAGTFATLDACINSRITALGPSKADRWARVSAALGRARRWRDELNSKPDADAQRSYLEDSLSEIVAPITAYGVSSGEAFEYLNRQRRDIEKRLLPFAEAKLQEVKSAPAAARTQMRGPVNQLIRATDCEPCRERYREAMDAIVTAELEIAQAQAAAERQKTASLQVQLAGALRDANVVNAIAQNTAAGAPAVVSLAAAVASSEPMLNVTSSSRSLQQALTSIQQRTEAVKDVVREKP